MNPSTMNLVATVIFALALMHTFLASRFKFIPVELVFVFWALPYLMVRPDRLSYILSLNFTEPLFVLVALGVCGTRPVLAAGQGVITAVSRLLPFKKPLAFYVATLTVGPLLGSLITEPAAMVVTARILLARFYGQNLSPRLMYATLGLLFVNVSVGGTLTSFAAPPILMVAPVWGWDFKFVLMHLGWRGGLTCLSATAATAFFFRREISALRAEEPQPLNSPRWLSAAHLLCLGLIVIFAHQAWIFVTVFAAFLALYARTREHQDHLEIKEGALVALFLAGLVVLGPPQSWWLEPLLTGTGANALFWGATALTAIMDNAALTYLGAQVPALSELSRLALVSGAVVGGGLTIIANAPNPAGYGILKPAFKDGISPLGLLAGALPPTVIASLCFWLI